MQPFSKDEIDGFNSITDQLGYTVANHMFIHGDIVINLLHKNNGYFYSIGLLTVSETNDYTNKPAYQVESIIIHPKYRSLGLAKLLYKIYFTRFKEPLISGSSQTNAGRRMWKSLLHFPNVEVSGLIGIEDSFFDDDENKESLDNIVTKLMQIGGEYAGFSRSTNVHWFTVPIRENKHELNFLKNFKLYHNNGDYFSVLIAKTKTRKHKLSEEPLTDYMPLGDFEKAKGGFRSDVDKKLVTNPTNIAKLYKFFNTTHEIRLFPVQVRGGGKWVEHGEIHREDLPNVVGVANTQRILSGQSDDNITVVYTNNFAAERIPLTPWMMAHRMGHTLRRRSNVWITVEKHLWKGINEILFQYYGIQQLQYKNDIIYDPYITEIYRVFINNIGTMHSARNNQIKRITEFIYELFAQYLNNGEITFNNPPQRLLSNIKAWGRSTTLCHLNPDLEIEAKQSLETLSYDIELLFNDVMSNATGKIFIM